MSEESTAPDVVECVRIILDAAGREEWDTILSFYDPAAVWHSADGMETLKGPTAIRGFFEDWWSSYERLDVEVSETLDLGSGIVLAVFHFGGRPRESAAEVHTEMALVYEWEQGVVARVTSYFDVDEARAAAEHLAEERLMSEKSGPPNLVELTRNVYDAANSGDFDAMTSFFAADAVWVSDEGVGTFEGLAAIRRFAEDWQGSYDQYEAEVEEILDLGTGVTFAISVQTGRLAGSSRDIRIRFAAVYTWVEGSIVRMTSFNDLDEARAAAERLAEERG